MKIYSNLGIEVPRAHPRLSGYHIPTRKQEIWERMRYLIMAFLSLIGFAMSIAILIG